MRLVTAALISCLAHTTLAATVTHNFTIGWVLANPDGAQVRPVIGINGAWPIPRIDVDIHDRLIVNVRNDLGNQSTSLHFHGLFQNGTTQMDGPAQVSQCAIPPGHSSTYNFTVDQPGTYWYHSHTQSQYPDGLRGALVVHDPKSPYDGKYDEEVVLTLSDWYHDQMAELIPKFLNKRNPTGAEPVPQAALMNDTQNLTLAMQPGKTYLIRMVNMAAFAAQYVWFEGHDVQVVEVDGVYTKPSTAEMLYIAAAQRCSVLLTAKNDTSSNFPIVGSMDTSLFDTIPDGLNWNVTGWLVYDDAKPKPEPKLVDEYTPIDDMTLVPYDDQPRLPEPDKVVELDVVMQNLGDGANYAFFNNITYVAPKVPTLYTALTAGGAAADPEVYGAYTHAFVLKRNQVVQINVNNLDPGRHPFHLHGHHFQALHRSPEDGGTVEASGVNETAFPAVPMRRDTVVVWPSGNVVLRFRADNPGVWLFHCHIEWHVTSGLIATFVEAPLHLQRALEVPEDHFAVCEAAGVPTAGNAAGNSRDLLDLAGENKPPPPLPAGFTTRGIVAFVFSCVAGILGIIVVAWYGMAGGPEDERNGADEVSSPAALGAASFWADGAGQGSENRVETGSGSLRAASRAS